MVICLSANNFVQNVIESAVKSLSEVPKVLASNCRLTDLVAPDSWMWRLRSTGALPSTARSA
jgi:hypothetical protein